MARYARVCCRRLMVVNHLVLLCLWLGHHIRGSPQMHHVHILTYAVSAGDSLSGGLAKQHNSTV